MTAVKAEKGVEDGVVVVPVPGRNLAVLLCLLQFSGTILGSVQALRPTLSSTLLRLLIIVQLSLTLALLAVGFDDRRKRPSPPFLISNTLVLFAIILLARFLLSDGALQVYVDNALRLGLPLCVALRFTRSPDIINHSVWWLRRYAPVADICACITLASMAISRSHGWYGTWITDPITPLVAFPLIFREKGVSIPRVLLYGLVITVSGKRWLLLAWITAVLLGALIQPGKRARSILLIGISAAAVVYVLMISGQFHRVEVRTTSALNLYKSGLLQTATSTTAMDPSIGQRMEELKAEVSALLSSPVSIILGRDLVDIRLNNGVITHAIHCTPVFFLARGGLVWLVAVISVAGSRPSTLSWPTRLGVAVTLLASISGNTSLDLGFLLSVSVLAHGRSKSTAL